MKEWKISEDLIKKLLKYIEDVEVWIDEDWGNRSISQLITDGATSSCYNELKKLYEEN